MATNLDNFSIKELITIIIGNYILNSFYIFIVKLNYFHYLDFLKICGLPMHFLAVSYAFNIYQKLKSDNELEYKSRNLFKSISIKINKDYSQKQYITKDLDKIINYEKNWADTAVIIACFLGGISVSFITYFVLIIFL